MSIKIGVLTGGGDCPGLNAVVRSVVKTAIHDYQMEVVGFMDGYEGLIENRYKDLEPPAPNAPYWLSSFSRCLVQLPFVHLFLRVNFVSNIRDCHCSNVSPRPTHRA